MLNKGTVEEFWVAKLLESGGVDPKTVKFLPISSSQEGVAALKTKRATGIWGGGQTVKALQEIEGVKAIADLKSINAQTVNMFLSTQKFLQENKETVVKYVKALDEIVTFIKTKPEKTAEIVEKKANMPKEQVLINLQRNDMSLEFNQDTIDALDAIYQWGREAGFIKNAFDTRDYVNVDALRDAFPERVNYK
jgi:NitT/TauT family transport system substrate-binding protein